MYNFGDMLKELRISKGLTQKKLALRVNVSESLICRYERGEMYPPFETLRSLCGVLGVSLDELSGTQERGTVSLYGITEQQAETVKKLILIYRKHNEAIKKEITQEDYETIGRIIAELNK